MLHNDADDAVPWYQGIELYIVMRRPGKEAYLFNYNGEPHGIQGVANQKDWAMRMQTFFDRKLKGAAEPDWMVNGIAYNDRGEGEVHHGLLRGSGGEEESEEVGSKRIGILDATI